MKLQSALESTDERATNENPTEMDSTEDSKLKEEKLPARDYRTYAGEDIKPYGLEHSDDEDVTVGKCIILYMYISVSVTGALVMLCCL